MSEQRLIDANALLMHECEADKMGAMLVVGKGYILDAPTVPAEAVVHCENCKHIHVLNTSEIYAICDKTNFVFQPFGVDTREFGCPYGERRESEGSK